MAVLNEDLTNVLANLDVTPGQAPSVGFIAAPYIWTPVEDEGGIAELAGRRWSTILSK